MTEGEALATGLLDGPETDCLGLARYRSSLDRPPFKGAAQFNDGVLTAVWVSEGAVLAPDSQLLGLTLDELRTRLGPDYDVILDGPGGPFSGTRFTVSQNREVVYGGVISPRDVGMIVQFGVPYVPACE